MPLENFLIIDIETVAAQQDYNFLSSNWQHLWEEKLKKQFPKISP